MKYTVIRVKAGDSELEGETIATDLTTPEFEDTGVEPGKRYEYIIEAYTDDGKYQDRNVVFTKTVGEPEPDYEVDPLDCDAYTFTDNYTAFSTIIPIEILHDEQIDKYGESEIPGAENDTEFTLIATEEVETRPIIGGQTGVEKVNVYVYEADFEWENEVANSYDDVPYQLPWLHDVFQFKNGKPKTMVGVFTGARTQMKCGMQVIRDAVENGLIVAPDLNHAFAGNSFEDGVPDFVGDAAPVKLKGAFAGCAKLNQELNIDSSNVENFTHMFYGALRFNSPVNLDTSKGTNFKEMFKGAVRFDQPLDFTFAQDDISLYGMFSSVVKFNQDISGWNVENVTTFDKFLYDALSFDQDLSGWTTSEDVWCRDGNCEPWGFAYNSPIADSPEKLPQWHCCDDDELPTKHKFISTYELAWFKLPTGDDDNGSLNLVERKEVETVDPDWIEKFYNEVPWDDGPEVLIEYFKSEQYQELLESVEYITVNGFVYEADFSWNNEGKKNLSYILDVLEIKNNQIDSGYYAFRDILAPTITALPKLDTSNLTDMEGMFYGCHLFDDEINHFDTSNVLTMKNMFAFNVFFNKPVNNWKVDKVQQFYGMFYASTMFNQELNEWNTSAMYNALSMFAYAFSFNKPLDSWATHNLRVPNWGGMFMGALSFDQDISGWCAKSQLRKPEEFDTYSAFEGNDAKQPKWGQAC